MNTGHRPSFRGQFCDQAEGHKQHGHEKESCDSDEDENARRPKRGTEPSIPAVKTNMSPPVHATMSHWLACFEERLLHDVRSPQLAAKTGLELEPRHQFKVVAVTFQVSGIGWFCVRHFGPLGNRRKSPQNGPRFFCEMVISAPRRSALEFQPPTVAPPRQPSGRISPCDVRGIISKTRAGHTVSLSVGNSSGHGDVNLRPRGQRPCVCTRSRWDMPVPDLASA